MVPSPPNRLIFEAVNVRPDGDHRITLRSAYNEEMTRIRILPLEIEVEAKDGATLMGAAQEAGYYWPTTCNGEGRCTTCACDVIEGAPSLDAMGRAERKSLVYERGEAVLATAVRLACQARLRPGASGTIIVRKAGVRPPVT